MSATGLRLRSRPATWAFLAGAGVGILAVGLLLPFVVGDPVATTRAASGAGASTITGAADAGSGGAGGPSAAEEGGPDAGTGTGAGSAPSGPATAGGAASRSAATEGSGALGATDVGVTPTEIRVGIIIPDLGTVGRSGFNAAGDPAETVRWWQAYVDEVNESGGVAGRQLAPFFRTVDIISESDRRAACLELTEDKKVFAVLSDQALQQADILCVTQEHQRPFVAGADISNEAFRKSNGLLFSHDAGAARVLANMAWLYDAERGLRDRKIGIVSNESSNASVNDGLLPALKTLGYEVVHHSRLPLLPTDAEAQVPVEVSQMRRKGVDLVFMAIDPINGSIFVRNAEAQLFRPQWVTADNSANTNDTSANYHADAYEGAVAVTALRAGWFRADEAQAPFDERCRGVLQARLGRAPDPRRTRTASESSQYATSMRACGILRLFAGGAAAAGGRLTAATFSSAMQGLGPVELGYAPAGSLQPGKFAAGGDQLRLVRFVADCGDGENCWVPASAWRQGHFR